MKFQSSKLISTLFATIGLALFMFARQGSYADVKNRCINNGTFVFTFDDGPGDQTEAILEILRVANVKVTFHFVTQYMTDDRVRALMKKCVDQGHQVGLRCETSWNLDSMQPAEITGSINQLAGVVQQFTGQRPRYMRLPYGTKSPAIIAAVEAAGMIITEGNLDSKDYQYTNDPDAIYNAVDLALKLKLPELNSHIAVFHDAVPAVPLVLRRIIDLVRQQYSIVTLGQCVGASKDPVINTPTGRGSVPTGALPAGGASGKGIKGSIAGSSEGSSSGEKATYAFGIVVAALIGALMTVF